MNRKTYINPLVFNKKQLNVPTEINIHLNPNFNRPCNVHFNPRIVNLTNVKNNVPAPPNVASNSHQPTKFSWHRKPNIVPKPTPKKTAPPVYLSPTKRKLIRRQETRNIKSSNKVWKKDQFKYEINKTIKQTKFKVDKRGYNFKRSKMAFNLESLFPKNFFRHNKMFNQQNSSRSKVPPLNAKAESSSKKLVNVGGISYRVTSKKMTRTTKLKNENVKKPANKTIINVKGEKYLLSDNGAKLCRLSSSTITRKRERLDFGGVTFRKITDNVLVRTNCHKTRSALIQAKQRSIACLAAKRRKINSPCLFFRKFGRCQRNEEKKCIYIHDKKNVDLCKRFLRGDCKEENCLLSHDAGYQKVATCQYYLDGKCFREDCPYLHVKVSAKAEICRAFLEGYCSSGEQCIMRHINICPDFEKTGICKKGKNCPYPHKKQKKRKNSLNKSKYKFSIKAKRKSEGSTKEKKKMKEDDCGTRTRYYVPETEPVPGTSHQEQGLVPKRNKISKLPSFIALSDS